MPYFDRPKAQPISSVIVREQLERSKTDQLALLGYLEKVAALPDKKVSSDAKAQRETLIQSTATNVDLHTAYRFMFQLADYIAQEGGL